MKLKRENKGFSLVELVVTIAIFSIVSIVIGGFMIVSSRTYSVSANELDIQEEAQLVANQLQEMILDTSLGISYQYVVTDATGTELVNYMTNDLSIPAGDLSKKELWIYGNGYYYQVYWDKENSKLMLVENVKKPEGYVLADGMTSDGVVLGEWVTNFSVDLSKVATDRIVSFDITFKKPFDDRDYVVSKNISLRNNVLTNRTTTEVYNSVGLEFEPVPDQIMITPTSGILWPGEALPFSVTLQCSRGGVPNQDVNWSLTSGDAYPLDAGTDINYGNILQVSVSENSSKLNITATADGYDYTNNIPQTLQKDFSINIRQIRGLTITRNDFETTSVGPNGTYILEVTMSGDNISDIELVGDNGVDVSITQGSSYATVTNITPMGNLKARITVQLSNSAPQGGKVALSITPKRAGFSDVVANTDIYLIGGDNEILSLTSESGSEWVRLGSATSSVEFVDDSTEDAHCNADGTLKSEYFIKYIYEVYDSTNCLVKTAYTTTGSGNGSDYTTYFAPNAASSMYKPVLDMTDEIFLTSGTVSVQAYLMEKTAGQPVVVGTSNICNYTIPQAVIGFKRAQMDTESTNMKSYVTNKENISTVYITLRQGFAPGTTPRVFAGYMNFNYIGDVFIEGTTVIEGERKAIFTADTEAVPNKNDKFVFTYGGLANSVTITLMEANVLGEDFYVPMSIAEWTYSGAMADTKGQVHDYYTYYMNDTHKMEIEYVDGVFKNAEFCVMENLQWVKKRDYNMNVVEQIWDLGIS